MTTIAGTDGDVTGAVSGKVLRSFTTATIDLLAAGATYSFNTPLVAGKKLRTLNVCSLHVVTRTGALGTNIVVTLAQNGVTIQSANTNYTPANVNTVAAPARVSGSNVVSANIDLTSLPLQMTIVTPGTGPTVMTGYFEVWGTYE